MPVRWYPTQKSFVGGEISPRYFAQLDEETVLKSCAEMTNYIPTLQGPAVKRPGTLFSHEVSGNARLFQMQSVDGRYTLVQLTDSEVKIFIDTIDQSDLDRATAFTKQLVQNESFQLGLDGWYTEPSQYKRGKRALGCYWESTPRDGLINMFARREGAKNYALIRRSFDVDYPTDRITFVYRASYTGKTGKKETYPTITLKIGTTEGGDDVYTTTLSGPRYTTWDDRIAIDAPAAGYTGTLWVEARILAADNNNFPDFKLEHLRVFGAAPAILTDQVLASPYTEDELDAIQHIQSPYGDKELIFVHKDHTPRKLYYDTGTASWKFEAITFVSPPSEWAANNYPQICTSFQGRLVLGGTPSQSETVWMSKSGEWDNFTAGTNPGDPIEAVVIYRSPTRWAHGHKNLIVGAGQYEYAFSSSSGLLQPSDTQVYMQSAHGSAAVQPANLGYGVLFAAEGGRKARLLELSDQDRGWLAPDVSLQVDHLLKSGIKRMAVIRAPQQMVLCVCNDGTVAALTIDRQLQIAAWSRIIFNGSVKDLCVITDDSKDTPYLVVERSVNGELRRYVEIIPNMENQAKWHYVDSAYRFTFTAETTLLTGLDHLEGADVYILTDTGDLIDTKTVVSGTVELDQPILRAIVGAAYDSQIVTMPIYTDARYGGISAMKRYSEIVVRVLQSAIPEINGIRPGDRTSTTPMDFNEPLFSGDVRINSLGYDTFGQITISEPLPLPSIIVGISGKINSSEV